MARISAFVIAKYSSDLSAVEGMIEGEDVREIIADEEAEAKVSRCMY
jgi:hypothetical protein